MSMVVSASAADFSKGVLRAVPVSSGQALVIDGSLNNWDLSGAEDIWISPDTTEQYHARIAALYDERNLYFAVEVSLPGRALRNPNSPVDPFWQGDCVQIRMNSDPALPWPASKEQLAASGRVVHLSLWKDTQADKDNLHISFGTKFNQGHLLNPPEAQICIKASGMQSYVVTARIPWAVLRVPGGLAPCRAGGELTFITEILWDHTTRRVAAIYRENPGVFAFHHPEKWGRLRFSPVGNLPPRRGGMKEMLANGGKAATGVPIELQLDQPCKVSLNILGASGEVLRELTGAEPRPAGKSVWYWDGCDQWGAPLAPGKYRWGAYLSGGLKARWVGTVGTSGDPTYPTADGRGAWGGDHGEPVDVAADASGLYFLWDYTEEGRAVVKTDYAGKVLWRKNPFIGGGFGPFYSIATNGKYVFLSFGRDKPTLVKLDAMTGKLLTMNGSSAVPIAATPAAPVAAQSAPYDPSETCGLACNDREIFAPVFSQNLIRVFAAEDGRELRTLSCPGPRGVALDRAGNLYAVCAALGQPGSVVTFAAAQGAGKPVITTQLAAPWDVAVDAVGQLHVTDCGTSQQVKVFSLAGELRRSIGKPGGRPWTGAYDTGSLRNPAGIAADLQGGILVAEHALPKPISRYDAQTGALRQRWFGATAYAPTNIPDPDNPRVNYYSLEGLTGADEPGGNHGFGAAGFARAEIPAAGGSGFPDAYWSLPRAGLGGAGLLLDTMNVPEVLRAANGKKYLVSDSSIGSQCHGIALIEGDVIRPIAHARILDGKKEGHGLEFWSDANLDQQVQPEELRLLRTVGAKPIAPLATTTGSMWMAQNGDLYFTTHANSILKVPVAGMAENGVIQWDLARAFYVVPTVLPALKDRLFTCWREGLLGVRADSAGNVYCCYNAKVPYATPEQTARMCEGVGHTALFNAVKFAKFDAAGKPLWTAGRKATQAARPGEMYHFWVLGGLVGDEYVSGCSEWGQIYFYTQDGFYVDALMEDPMRGAEAGPYTFGGETFSGRVRYFPELDEVWAYSCGHAYRVDGFHKGRVRDERRLSGTVMLDKAYREDATVQVAAPLKIVALSDPLLTPQQWQDVPPSVLQRNGQPLAAAQLGYNQRYLFARIHVQDETPLQNSADDLKLAFKWGDCAGLDLGRAGTREKPEAGDIRLLAAMIQGRPRLIAYKPFTQGAKDPGRYVTPAGGEVNFEYAGEVPGAEVALTPDADGKGYTAVFAVPRVFLELPFRQGDSLKAEIEVLLSGQGARGLQTLGRNYLFTPRTSHTTMVDDIPTEARLYPRYWGVAMVQ